MVIIPQQQQADNQISLQLLGPFEDALMLANPGVSHMQAKTIVYWALATYYDFDPKPILLIYHSFGCGKTDLLTTLFPMVDNGRWIDGNSYAVVRDELDGCRTAFLDERDDDNDNIPESLLRKRFRQSNSRVSVNRNIGGAEFTRQGLNINGYTVVARRNPFRDVALTSRCLVISPEFIENPDARVTNPGSLQGIVDQLGHVEPLPSEGRAMQVWRPLAAIAGRFNDREWIDYAAINLTSDVEEQDLGRQYEPEEAVVGALEICKNSPNTCFQRHWIKISDIKRTANGEFETTLKPQQVVATLHRRGFEVSTIDGYPAVRVDD
ncbi:hypothetical protein ACFLUJ_06940 [Chloroflexota bacterium]